MIISGAIGFNPVVVDSAAALLGLLSTAVFASSFFLTTGELTLSASSSISSASSSDSSALYLFCFYFHNNNS